MHQDPVTGADLPEDPDARSYLISGTDHIGLRGEAKRMFPVNWPHNLDPSLVVRALFVQSLSGGSSTGSSPAERRAAQADGP